jgi:signal transduction histidine kinase
VNLLSEAETHSPDGKQLLALARNTVLQMENMLDELEHFLENSKRDVTYFPVACINVINSVLMELADEIKDVRVEVCNEQTVPFFCDPARLRIILSNLIRNAIQFRDVEKPGSHISIKVKTSSNNCTISVADNGVGIDSAHHSNIFRLFYRASERSAGPGIGLYVVRETVEKMGGRIKVNSIPKKGSMFTITLPA